MVGASSTRAEGCRAMGRSSGRAATAAAALSLRKSSTRKLRMPFARSGSGYICHASRGDIMDTRRHGSVTHRQEGEREREGEPVLRFLALCWRRRVLCAAGRREFVDKRTSPTARRSRARIVGELRSIAPMAHYRATSDSYRAWPLESRPPHTRLFGNKLVVDQLQDASFAQNSTAAGTRSTLSSEREITKATMSTGAPRTDRKRWKLLVHCITEGTGMNRVGRRRYAGQFGELPWRRPIPPSLIAPS